MNILKSKIFWGITLGLALLGGLVGTQSGVPAGGMIFGFLGGAVGAVISAYRISVEESMSWVTENNFTATLEFKLSQAKLFTLLNQSLNAQGKCKIEYSNADEGKLIAKLPVTLGSWGEIISFQITDFNGKSSVVIKSTLPVPTPLYDYDKSKEVVKYLMAHNEQQTA